MSTGLPNNSEYGFAQPRFLMARPTWLRYRARHIPARHRSPCQGRDSSQKKMLRLSSKPTTVKKNPVVLWGDHSLNFRRTCPASEPSRPARHRSLIASTCRVDMLRLGTLGATRPARHRSPAEPAPRSGFFLPRSDFRLRFLTEVGFPTSLFARKTHHRASAEGPSAGWVLARPLTWCFFTIHTPCRQSWREHRIALVNPAAATGLLQPFLC